MSDKFKHLILNNWYTPQNSLLDALNSLRDITLSCYDLGKERRSPTIIHFESKASYTSVSLLITDGVPGIRFEFSQSTSAFFDKIFEPVGLNYEYLSQLDGNEMSLLIDMFSDEYNVRQQDITFANFASSGSFFLTVNLDSNDENAVDLAALLLSQHSSIAID